MFVPSFIALSMSCGLATPSMRRLNASFIIGTRSRFTTNPGDSFTSTGSFPSLTESDFANAVVSSLVSEPRITSTSFITGAGLKKCIRITRSARRVAPAISVMLREDVLLAKTTSGGHIESSSENRAFFASIFSMIASMTTCAPETASLRLTVPRMFARTRSTSSFDIFPFSTRFISGSRIRRKPPSTKRCSISRIATSYPAWEHTCAIPAPMEPAPITATFFTRSSCILIATVRSEIVARENVATLLGNVYDAFHFRDTRASGSFSVTTDSWIREADLGLVKISISAGSFTTNFTFDPPQAHASFPLVVGKNWTVQVKISTKIGNGNPFTVDARFAAQVDNELDVSVPAGTFRCDSVKEITTSTYTKFYFSEQTGYWAKQERYNAQNNSQGQMVLTSYHYQWNTTFIAIVGTVIALIAVVVVAYLWRKRKKAVGLPGGPVPPAPGAANVDKPSARSRPPTALGPYAQ